MTTISVPEAMTAVERAVFRYEKIKLAIVTFSLVILMALSAGVLIEGQDIARTVNTTRESLVILRCAVAKDVRSKPDGTPRNDADARAHFDTCLKAGGPAPDRP